MTKSSNALTHAGQIGTRTPPASNALKDYLVLDLTRVRSGPTCVRQLADWGADVIKIETPADDAQLGGPREGPDFQNLHRNKRSLTLNLKSDAGMKIFRQLAAKADVIVENFRPDVKNRLGIDYKTLSKTNPRLVYASISGFGQDGPYSGRPGFDQIAQGMGGLMSITGAPGEGANACWHSDCRPLCRPFCCAGYFYCVAGTSTFGSRGNGCRPRCCRRKCSCSIFRRHGI
jgi:crotonobetainyl-CoA:carnitine CoA-transferase CaiB-like acyl-CoA transferase